MEGLSLEFLPGMASLAAAILLLAVLVAGVLYVWHQDRQQRAVAEQKPLKKAA